MLRKIKLGGQEARRLKELMAEKFYLAFQLPGFPAFKPAEGYARP